jgi:glycosyltransferase involved in cell wall biosynthesis
MKVLQLIDSLEAGGAERIAVTYANTLSKQLDSYLCVTRAEGVLKETVSENVGYLFLNKKKSLDLKAIFLLRKYVIKNNIYIIHAHSSSYFLACLVKLTNPRVKIVWHNHFGNSVNLPFKQLSALKLASFLFSYNIAVNNILKDWAKEVLYCKKVVYIPNFVINPVRYVKETFLNGVPGSRIICLANLREEKDHINLLSAFELIFKNHSNWTLHFVGKNFDDGYSDLISGFIKKSNLENKVFLYGTCIDVNHILAQSNIAVLSSKFEGLPMSLLEYGNSELPVVVTKVGECSSVIEDGKNGLLVSPENSKELFIGISKLIESEQLRNKLAKQFKKDIIDKYTATSVVSDIIKLYNSLLNKK